MNPGSVAGVPNRGQILPRLDASILNKGIAFEEKCAHLLRAMGFTIQTTEEAGDGGKDPMLSGLLVMQCKDW